MDLDARIAILNRIITGFTLVNYGNFIYKVCDPDCNSKHLADEYYKEIYDEYIYEGCLNEDYALQLLISKKIWNEDLEKEINSIELREEKLLNSINDYEFQSDVRNQIIKNIDKLKSRQAELIKIKSSIANNTIEYLARIEKYKKLVFLNTYDVLGNRIWTDWEIFDKNTNDFLIKKLLYDGYFSNSIEESDFREIARSEPWRTYWKLSTKTGSSLFDKPATQITDYQRILVSWSILYDSVYESSDCPSEEVINNDLMLDAWLVKQKEKRTSKQPSELIKNNKIKNSKEIGIMVNTTEDAQKVYNLNDANGKSIINQRQKALQTKGTLREDELPDIKQQITMDINKMNSQRKK